MLLLGEQVPGAYDAAYDDISHYPIDNDAVYDDISGIIILITKLFMMTIVALSY